MAPETGVPHAQEMSQNAAGFGARLRDEPLQAKECHCQALDLYQGLDAEIGVAHNLCGLGFAEHLLGDDDQASHHLRTALTLAFKTGRLTAAAAIEGLACEAVERDAGLAAKLLCAARNIRQTSDIRLTLIEGHDPVTAEPLAISALGRQRTKTVMRTGATLSRQEVLALAGEQHTRMP